MDRAELMDLADFLQWLIEITNEDLGISSGLMRVLQRSLLCNGAQMTQFWKVINTGKPASLSENECTCRLFQIILIGLALTAAMPKRASQAVQAGDIITC